VAEFNFFHQWHRHVRNFYIEIALFDVDLILMFVVQCFISVCYNNCKLIWSSIQLNVKSGARHQRFCDPMEVAHQGPNKGVARCSVGGRNNIRVSVFEPVDTSHKPVIFRAWLNGRVTVVHHWGLTRSSYEFFFHFPTRVLRPPSAPQIGLFCCIVK